MNAPAALLTSSIDVAIFEEVAAGLRQRRKILPSKLFYDQAGARLFEQITELPEYYPTRTELQILRTEGAAMGAWIGRRARLVEFGSGSGEKTRVLLRQVADIAEYVPVDIEDQQLRAFARELKATFPQLRVRPVNADYTRRVALPKPLGDCARTVVFFPGSTIGNFTPREAVDFLKRAALISGAGGGLLIGVDLRKDRVTLERAYNDAAGVTAAFNLNMLTHINRLCAADFNISAFTHRAIYNELHGRIEMHLVSNKAQVVTLARTTRRPVRIQFDEGEAIVTEYSYKYEVEGFQALARRAGYAPAGVWTDARCYFSVQAFDQVLSC